MSRIGFLGLGNMGLPMARNLIKAGFEVCGFDLTAKAVEALVAAGGRGSAGAVGAVDGADVVITMLPEGRHVASAYRGEAGILASAAAGTLLIDCSTIDVATSRAVHEEAAARGLAMLDAPVSGGTMGAEGATLTFMVGGEAAALDRARPLLEAMGKTIVHAGAAGNGQAAKICNNMLLGIHMISVSEAFVLAKRLGLPAEKLFEISGHSSGQCWSLTSYCPVPGLVPASAANRDYRPGFSAAMMLKDLRLAQTAAQGAGVATPLGAEAYQLYALFAAAGNEGLDFSAIIKMIEGVSG